MRRGQCIRRSVRLYEEITDQTHVIIDPVALSGSITCSFERSKAILGSPSLRTAQRQSRSTIPSRYAARRGLGQARCQAFVLTYFFAQPGPERQTDRQSRRRSFRSKPFMFHVQSSRSRSLWPGDIASRSQILPALPSYPSCWVDNCHRHTTQIFDR